MRGICSVTFALALALSSAGCATPAVLQAWNQTPSPSSALPPMERPQPNRPQTLLAARELRGGEVHVRVAYREGEVRHWVFERSAPRPALRHWPALGYRAPVPAPGPLPEEGVELELGRAGQIYMRYGAVIRVHEGKTIPVGSLAPLERPSAAQAGSPVQRCVRRMALGGLLPFALAFDAALVGLAVGSGIGLLALAARWG